MIWTFFSIGRWIFWYNSGRFTLFFRSEANVSSSQRIYITRNKATLSNYNIIVLFYSLAFIILWHCLFQWLFLSLNCKLTGIIDILSLSLGAHSLVFRGYSWFCAWDKLLVMLGEAYMQFQELELGLATCN